MFPEPLTHGKFCFSHFTLTENIDTGLMHGLIQAFLQMTHHARLWLIPHSSKLNKSIHMAILLIWRQHAHPLSCKPLFFSHIWRRNCFTFNQKERTLHCISLVRTCFYWCDTISASLLLRQNKSKCSRQRILVKYCPKLYLIFFLLVMTMLQLLLLWA